MKMFRDGRELEKALFGPPDPMIWEVARIRKPISFKRDVGRIIKSIIHSRPYNKFPRTIISRILYSEVKKQLEILGVCADGLRLFSLLGTDADKYYETDALFYLPQSCGYESVVTIDSYLIDPILLSRLRDYWIDAFEGNFYSEDRFQGDLFAHKRMLAEHRSSAKDSLLQNHEDSWELSREYKRLWVKGYLPAIEDGIIDRPMMRPTNHLVVTMRHLGGKSERVGFTRFVAQAFWEQIFPDKVVCAENESAFL